MVPLTQAPQITILNRDSRLFDVLLGVAQSQGAADAFKPVILNSNGILDPNLTATGTSAIAAESIVSGSLVNLFDNAGTLTARLASAESGPGQHLATGFVMDEYNTTDTVTIHLTGRFVYSDNIHEFSAGDIGAEVFLSAATPGHVTKTRPIGVGQIDQVVGYVIGFTAGGTNFVTIAFGTGVRDFSQMAGTCQITQGGTGATTAGTALTNLLAGSYTQNEVLASPDGSSGNISLRVLVPNDIPNLDAAKLTSGLLAMTRGGTGVDLSSSGGTTKILAQDASHVITARNLVAGDIPALPYDPTGAAATAQTNAEAYTDIETARALAAEALLAPLASPDFTGDTELDGAHGEVWLSGQATELITLNTGAAFTDSAANLLPANAIIESVVARVTTTIAGVAAPTVWAVGDATTAARFISNDTTLTSGETQVGINQWKGSVATDAAGPTQSVVAKVRITLDHIPDAGAVRVTVFYRQFVAPTS